jgi:ammonia channel protein AmtB
LDPNFPHDPAIYFSYSLVDAIACAICNIVSFSPLIGRIRKLEILILVLVSGFLYEINEQLLWEIRASDTGYGMRIFIYGGLVGLVASLIVGNEAPPPHRENIINPTTYTTRSFSLLGLLFQFCTFPCLVAASLYATSNNNAIIFSSSVLRMYLAVAAGFLGAATASAIIYRKIIIHDFLLSALAVNI